MIGYNPFIWFLFSIPDLGTIQRRFQSNRVSSNGNLFPIRPIANSQTRNAASSSSAQINQRANILRRCDTSSRERSHICEASHFQIEQLATPNLFEAARNFFTHSFSFVSPAAAKRRGRRTPRSAFPTPQLVIVSDCDQPHVLVFPNANPIRLILQFGVCR
jgi:hypothetical protein